MCIRDRHRAVGGRSFERLQRNAAARAGLIFHHARVFAERAASPLLGHAAGHGVARAAGGEAEVHLHLIHLGMGGKGVEGAQRGAGAKGLNKLTAGGGHADVSWLSLIHI